MLKLAAGSPTQAVLPFTGLNYPGGVAVDSAGNLYVTDGGNNRVLKLAAGLAHPDRAAVHRPQPTLTGVAVDSAGNLYVTDR